MMTLSPMMNSSLPTALTTAGGHEPTMSSREIADLTGKKHSAVMRDIRVMLDGLAMDQKANLHFDNSGAKGRTVYFYMLPKDLTMTLVAGYSIPFRLAIVMRWQTLESQAAHQSPVIPTTFSEALRLAAEQAEQIEQQAALIQLQQPKVEYHDAILSTSGALCLRDALKSIGYKPNKALDWLRDNGYLGERNKPYQRHIESGYFLLRQRKDITGEIRTQTLVTAKGAHWIAKLLAVQLELRA